MKIEDRQLFIDKQFKLVKEQYKNCMPSKDFRMWMSESGYCYRCKGDVIEAEIKKGNDGSKEIVTGCPICCRSYCD